VRNTVVAASKSTEAKGAAPLARWVVNLRKATLRREPSSPPGSIAGQVPSATGFRPFMPTANCHRISIQTISLSLSSPRCKGDYSSLRCRGALDHSRLRSTHPCPCRSEDKCIRDVDRSVRRIVLVTAARRALREPTKTWWTYGRLSNPSDATKTLVLHRSTKICSPKSDPRDRNRAP